MHNFWVKKMRTIVFEVNEKTKELPELLQKIGHIKPHEECPVLVISDVWNRDQQPHMDHVTLDALAPTYQKINFVDHSKHQVKINRSCRVIPTFSIVVYFNDVGSINFPKANLEFNGKRGRIFMFQNYDDNSRPFANDIST